MVVLGSIAGGGRGSTVAKPGHLPHDNGESTHVTPETARRGIAMLNGMKPAERQSAISRMHGSAKGFSDVMSGKKEDKPKISLGGK